MHLRLLSGRGRYFPEAEGFLPFGGDGIAFFHGHRGVFVKHLRAPASAPGKKVEEVIFADGAGAGRGIGSGFAVWNAAGRVMHRDIPRSMPFSMPVGFFDFQGLCLTSFQS
jgi:hypothetical protein